MGIAEDLLLKIANYGGAISKAVNAIPPILQRLQVRAERPGFFFQLPPPGAQVWERYLINDVDPLAQALSYYVIGQLDVPSGRTVVVTDITYFGIRPRALDNYELCDPVEFIDGGGFVLRCNGAPAYDVLTLNNSATLGWLAGRAAITAVGFLRDPGVKPQLSVVFRGACSLDVAFFNALSVVGHAPAVAYGARLCGFEMATTDFDKIASNP
jgi:hypothetical protein